MQQKISFFQPSKSYKSDTQGTNIAQPALSCGTGEAYPPPPYPKNLITAFFFSGICNKSLLFTGGTRQSCEKNKNRHPLFTNDGNRKSNYRINRLRDSRGNQKSVGPLPGLFLIATNSPARRESPKAITWKKLQRN